VQRVVDIFRPGKLTLTLFVSFDSEKDDEGETPVEAAQRAFKAALTRPSPTDSPITPKKTDFHAKTYKRTDKINYEFGGYELAFASFERM
jgi:S-adenosylmethionine decarboxylase